MTKGSLAWDDDHHAYQGGCGAVGRNKNAHYLLKGRGGQTYEDLGGQDSASFVMGWLFLRETGKQRYALSVVLAYKQGDPTAS